jgi:putative flippase GtrA
MTEPMTAPVPTDEAEVGKRARRLGDVRVLVREVLAYGVVGVLNFGLDLAVYQATYVTLGQGALTSKVVSTVVATTVAYFMHKRWSFAHRTGLARPRQEYVAFFALSVVSLLLGLGLIAVAHYAMGVTSVAGLQVANVVSIVLGVVFRFWAYRRFVFVG